MESTLRVLRAETWLTVYRTIAILVQEQPCPKWTEFIYTLDVLEEVSRPQNHHHMKMCHIINNLRPSNFILT